ncbi:hypothetical protein GHO29_11020 [Pseudomonas helleri]|uniref:Uncharacterized protein n=1 Tax=Pseudomonas helleri TaxID=1608996 RepID=A0A7X1XYG5_9PSED|nr:hypothetical protein [Pseudomonas helleri]MQU27016.1 hypothetical protein [Pseudomonas helleri]
MSDLISKAPLAREWLESTISHYSTGIFGRLAPAVIWSDQRGDDGDLLVLAEPTELVTGINAAPYILLQGHDPGRPIGRVLESASFKTDEGNAFVVAVLGYYAGGDVLGFRKLGLETESLVASPAELPLLADSTRIQLATDPREVDEEWLDQITTDSPLKIECINLSHNAQEFVQELIRVGLPYVLVVWNPLVTAIASEAGKAVYAASHAWLRRLLGRLADRHNPILDIQAFQNDCQVSFLFRGKDVKQHYSAHDALPTAAAQAARLITRLKERGIPGRELTYEFDKEAGRWFPSYGVLDDGRIITDSVTLISLEQLPTELSLGISVGPLSPIVRSGAEKE